MSRLSAQAIRQLAEALGVESGPDAEATAGLLAFAKLAERWGRKLDLTSAREPGALLEVLLADALVLGELELPAAGAHLIDVGAGVGAPTLPLLLMRPALSASLVEPRRKRVAFLRNALGELGLVGRAAVFETRVEPGTAQAPGGPHDLALSRATFKAPVWLGLGLALSPAVVVLAAAGELPAAPEGARLVRQRSYRLPLSDAPRKLGLYRRD